MCAIFGRDIFTVSFIDILSFKFLKILVLCHFKCLHLSFQVVVRFIRELISAVAMGVVHLIEVEGMFKNNNNRESQAFAQWIFWLENFKERCSDSSIFLSDQIHHLSY